MRRQPPPSPKRMADLGWTRIDPRPWGKLQAHWTHRSGWVLRHCGHPTAHWSWMLFDPKGRWHMQGLYSSGTRPTYGYCFGDLHTATDYVERMGTQAIAMMDRLVLETPTDVRWRDGAKKETGMILFRKVREEYGWLSNMSPHPVDGYRTAEALFQASRFEDTAIQEEIRACTSPMAAKMVAKRHAAKMAIHPRSNADLELMRSVVRRKLEAYPEMARRLLATEDTEIVEDVTARPNESGLFWGAVPTDNGLRGENHLGRIWMVLRAELKASP